MALFLTSRLSLHGVSLQREFTVQIYFHLQVQRGAADSYSVEHCDMEPVRLEAAQSLLMLS